MIHLCTEVLQLKRLALASSENSGYFMNEALFGRKKVIILDDKVIIQLDDNINVVINVIIQPDESTRCYHLAG
jgi:hypothetical protein